MLHGWIIDTRHQQFHEIAPHQLEEWRQGREPQQAGQLLWIDLCDPTEDDFTLLIQRLNLHPAVISNLRQTESRPKMQQFRNYYHLTAYAIFGHHTRDSLDKMNIEFREVDFLVTEQYVITVHPGTVPAWQKLAENWKSQSPRAEGGIAYVVYELLDSLLEKYFPVLDDISEHIDDLEDILFTGQGHAVSARIFALKRTLIRIRQLSSPMREVVGQLSRFYAGDAENRHVYFQDLYDHTMRILDMLDSFRDILSGSMDVYLAAQGNRMNEVMKILTSFSIIFLFPMLIAGIYGMNFEYMPELHTRNGYFICLGVILVSMLSTYIYFKRKEWI